ncbi:MAG: metallophosphoesterase, partial [Anaerolineales bacterium]|nr:metallophosphoesterase [Anaerolineales bacterium]
MKFSRTIKLTLTSLIIILSSFSGRPIPAKAQSDQIIFAVIGDFGLAGQPLLDVSNLIKSWSPDFIVTVGDNNYPNGGADTIDDNVGQYFHEYLIRYKGKYGEGSATRRFYPALGNHDWVSGANIYFSYFGYYNRITYYDFIQGSVHFFVLDSDRSEPDGVTYNSQQGIWLRKALAASTSPFNIVVLHHAPYSSGQHGSTEYMRWPFKEWGADAVLSGHDHIYERLLVDGIPYFVNGVGGGELYDIRDILPQSQVRFNQDYGAMRVEATSNTMKFQMYTRTGILVDEYTLGKQAPAVSSITRQNADPTNAATVNFQVTFT